MSYVDGFVLPIPAGNHDAYLQMARTGAEVFLAHGATRVVECVGDDVPHGKLTDFYRSVAAADAESVWFSWIEWPSKEQRDAGMQAAMKDPRMEPFASQMPFDGKRMIFGGFAPRVDARADGAAADGLGSQPAADAGPHELVLTRRIPVAREKLWRCWTESELLKQWFSPKPWRTTAADLDVRPGGHSRIRMEGPNGERSDGNGVFLEVVPNERLVFTDAYTEAWRPSAKPFMTGILTFERDGGGTLYTARVRHWSRADRDMHEKMGFHQGWSLATDQLTELAGRL